MFFFFFNSDDFIPSTKRDPEISKAIYKFNRSIAKGSSLLKLDQLLPKKNLIQTSPEQISFLKGILEHQFIDSHQAKIIKSILLIVETMPINKSITFVEDNYFRILLPDIDKIIYTLQMSDLSLSSNFSKNLIQALTSLRMIFMTRLSLGFGQNRLKDVSALALSMLANQKDIKSIQNAVSAKKLKVISGRGKSQRICSISARKWLVATDGGIKSRLTPLKTKHQIADINSFLKLSYLDQFKFSIVKKLTMDGVLLLPPGPGVYQFVDNQTNQVLYTGHSKNIQKRINQHFLRLILIKDCLLCIYENKTKNPAKALKQCRELENFFLRSNEERIDKQNLIKESLSKKYSVNSRIN